LHKTSGRRRRQSKQFCEKSFVNANESGQGQASRF
jgi:hypothetical protein